MILTKIELDVRLADQLYQVLSFQPQIYLHVPMSSLPTRSHTDEEWVHSIVKGDKSVKGELWEKVMEWGVTSARKRNQPDDLGREAAIQAFLRITKYAGRYKGKGLFLGWCRKITVNEVLRLIEKEQRAISTVDEPIDSLPQLGAADPSPKLELSGVLKRLDSCLQRLTQKEWQAIEGYYLQERTPASIAETLEIERNYVHQLMHQARKKLRKCLEGLGFGSSDEVLSL